MGFDFAGTYTRIVPNKLIEYALDDSRVVSVSFASNNGKVVISQTFEAEGKMDAETQRQGWQSILDNFAEYVRAKSG